jgi:ABC-2 type transport system ATP-binding protein
MVVMLFMGVHAVELERICHNYGDRIALDNVSLVVESASICALLGPNGGGKTTLFKILSTLITPHAGIARILGDDVVVHRDRVRQLIGVVFQTPSLDVHLTVRENMTHQGHLYGLSGIKLKERSDELLQRFEVQDRANDRAKKLSGGLQRRVELAKSLLHRPQVLVLDEPSTGLDPGARAALTDFLIELRDKDGVTSLLTTHLIDEADRCDRVAVIDKGKLMAQGTPGELKAMIGGDVITIRARDPVALAWQITSKFGVQAEVSDGSIRVEREGGHRFVPELIESFPGAIESVSMGRPTLGDVFQRTTGHALHSAGLEIT